MWVTSSLETALTPTAVALGNFDGVHRGHQQVVEPILGKRYSAVQSPLASPYVPQRQDEESSLSGLDGAATYNSEHIYATVVTFNPHPQEFFTGQPRRLLTPLDEKVGQLVRLGVEQLVLLPFDRELASLSPEQFVENILVQQLRCTFVSVGEDFCFGRQRSGTSANLQAIAASYGITTNIVPLQTSLCERISSSFIRKALQEGDMQSANRLLGRPYTLTGLVVRGQQLGRTLGFPTANLQVPPEKFLPRLGVYCVRVYEGTGDWGLGTKTCSSQSPIPNPQFPILGVMNIGYRPTVEGTTPTVEVHLLDWSGDLYGQTLTVSLEKFLRPEQKFASLDALKAQIQADARAARAFLGTNG